MKTVKKIAALAIALFLAVALVTGGSMSAKAGLGSYVVGGVDITIAADPQVIRSNTCTITDKSPLNQPYDEIKLSRWFLGQPAQGLDYLGLKTMVVIFHLDIAAKDDGYQEIYFYQNATTNQPLCRLTPTFQHMPGSPNTGFAPYEFYVEMPPTDSFCIRYGARGAGADTWYNKNLEMQICLSMQEPINREIKPVRTPQPLRGATDDTIEYFTRSSW